MRLRCHNCRNGLVITETICPTCKGTGSDKITLGVGEGKGDACPDCNGKGKLIDKTKCDVCQDGYIYICDFCGNEVEDKESNVCINCEENPIVIQLGQPLDYRYLDGKNALLAKVEDISPKGIRVDLGNGFLGHFKPYKDARYRVGQNIVIRLKYQLKREDRGRAIPVFALKTTQNYKVVKKTLQVNEMTFEELTSEVGKIGKITGQVTDIYPLRNGPTLFTLMDTKGKKIQGSVFGEDGSVAYPWISRNTIVNVVARYKIHNEKERLQIFTIDKIKEDEANEFLDNFANTVHTDGSDLNDVKPYIESDKYEQIHDNLIQVAKRLRRAVLSSQNIVMRYHSPCVDGASAAFAIDFALRKLLGSKRAKREDYRRLIRRLPQRNTILEIREIARDLSFALDDGANLHHLPLYVLVDLGSTKESIPALKLCKSFNLDVVVIDSHIPSEEVEGLVTAYVNPSSSTDPDSLTTGMIATEVAKIVSAEMDLTKNIIQLAAISGVHDYISSPEQEAYSALAEENEFDNNKIENIASALDYVIFGLRNFDGGEVIRSLMGISGSEEKLNELIETITPISKSLFAMALKTAQTNSVEEELSNGSKLITLNLEEYTPRFEYPSHNTILQALFNTKLDEEDKSVIVLGISSDYILLKNSSIDFSFDKLLEDLQEEHINIGITGYGGNSSGIIQFLAGHKDIILESVKKQLS